MTELDARWTYAYERRGKLVAALAEQPRGRSWDRPLFVFRRERSVKASRTGSTNPTRRKTGRPLGSVKLTEQIVDTIVSYVRAGAFDHVAAEAAGISARTFRDWMARGEGRGSRASTRKLRAFAERVREAQAEARAGAEIRVFQERPALWLRRAGRTEPDRDGWSEPRPTEPDPGASRFDDERLQWELIRFFALDIWDGSTRVPRCSHPRCRCRFHRKDPERRSEGIDPDQRTMPWPYVDPRGRRKPKPAWRTDLPKEEGR